MGVEVTETSTAEAGASANSSAPRQAPGSLPLPRRAARAAIRAYQLSFSALAGRHCRHWPTCSDYTADAVARHGVWAGTWIGLARICRCGPFGTHGLDLVCEALPERAAWYAPWRYGRWRGVNAPEREPVRVDATGQCTGPETRAGASTALEFRAPSG